MGVAVGEPELVKGQALHLVVPDPESPVLPFDDVSVDRETRPFRLRDDDGLLRRSRSRQLVVEVEVVALLRNLEQLVVDELGHFAAHEVEVGDHTIDRVRPGVVVDVLLQERQAAHDPLSVFTGDVETASGEGRDSHERDVGDAATVHRRDPAVVLAKQQLHSIELLVDDRRLPFGVNVDDDSLAHHALGNIHEHPGDFAGPTIHQHVRDQALRHRAGEDIRFVRLENVDEHKGCLGVGEPRFGQGTAIDVDLRGAESVEWVSHGYSVGWGASGWGASGWGAGAA